MLNYVYLTVSFVKTNAWMRVKLDWILLCWTNKYQTKWIKFTIITIFWLCIYLYLIIFLSEDWQFNCYFEPMLNITWVYLQCVTNLGSKHCFCERCWWISNVSGRVVSADNSLHSVYNCRQAAAETLVSGQWSPVAGTRRQWSSFPAQSQSHTAPPAE